MKNFIEELRQRNVLRVGAAYLVASWLILQFVEVVFPMLGLDEIELGRTIFLVLLAGFPVTLILAWVFEITPEGIKRDEDVVRTPATGRTGRRLDRAIIVILLLAVGLLLYDRIANVEPDSAPLALTSKSVAVLPFVNLSSEADTGYFADGLTESMLHALSQVPELRVPARTSVFAFKDSGQDIRSIAASLGVDTVLEGSVRRAGNQIRITAQLIQADSGFNLWSKTYDRSFDDIFAVQDEIAGNVASALQVTLLGARSGTGEASLVATSDAEAYERYLKALEQKNIASYSSLQSAEGLFKEALAIDPSFVEARIDLALTYVLQAETGLISQAESDTRARPLLEQVLALDPDHSRALAHLAVLDWQTALLTVGPVNEAAIAARLALEETIEFAPNEPALYAALAGAAAIESRFEDALVWLEEGLLVDPLSARLNLQMGRLLLGVLERPEDAERAFETALQTAPEWTALQFALGDAAFAQNKLAEGFRRYAMTITMDPQDHEIPAILGRMLFALDLEGPAEQMLTRAKALEPSAPQTRGLELEKHLRLGNHERVVSLARSILEDDLDDRGGAFSLAAFGYVSSMIFMDQSAAVVPFFEELRPGIADVSFPTTALKESTLRFALLWALHDQGLTTLSGRILTELLNNADRATPGWKHNDYLQMNIHLLRGDVDTASAHAVEDLSRPLGRNMHWRRNYLYLAWTQPLLKRPEVSARIDALEQEGDRASENIREALAGIL